MNDANNNAFAYGAEATGNVPPLPPLPTLPPLPPVDSNEAPPSFDLTGIEGMHKGIMRVEVARHHPHFMAFFSPKPNMSGYWRHLLCFTMVANLKRAGHKQIHYWHKSYAVVVSGENNESWIC